MSISPIRILSAATVVAIVLTAFIQPAHCDDKLSGEQIFQAKCASCHGRHGEGNTDAYGQPLVGDKSLGELIEFIDKTMPEDRPGTCVGEEARLVAKYIHNAFYSPTAQARNKPVRLELSRLTVRQYRNSIADLIDYFRPATQVDASQGLTAQYFKAREFETKHLAMQRVDPNIAFDFKDRSPDAERIPPHEFAIRWEGAIFAPDTGEYEFHIRTDHSFRLWVNNLKTPLIDSYVKSKTDVDDRGTIFLIGGRFYPLKLDFSKAKQGVQDGKAKDLPSAMASIAAEWKQPQRVMELIPARFLTSASRPEVCIVRSPFPPDDRSSGWERATSISQEWDQATTEAAIEIASYVTDRLDELSGVKADTPDSTDKLKEFCSRFAERAFRRPLDADTRRDYVDLQFERVADPKLAVHRVLLQVLKSPRFLYRELGATPEGKNDPWNVAARIAMGMWDSLPDEPLLEAAAAGNLTTQAQILAHVERMADDIRARSKLREFLLRWMKVEQVLDLSKDVEHFPDFTPQIADDLRTSLELFLEELLESQSSDYRQLLLSDSLFLNGRLAKVYGVNLSADAPFQKISLASEQRAGILTHPYLMSGFAYMATSSPIHRGSFVTRSLLGRAMRPPPEAIVPLAPRLHPDLTTRDRIALQTSDVSCQSCHGLINPLGFTLENFDAIGRFRTMESGKPVVTKGEYRTRHGDTVSFDGSRDLAKFLSESRESHTAFVRQLFQHSIKQPIRAYGFNINDQLRQAFESNHCDIRRLYIQIIVTSALIPVDPHSNSKSG